jgi:hemoglobin
MRSVLANGFFTKGLIMQKKDVWGFLVILGLLVSVSSAGLMGQGAMKQKSLYDRLGGKDAITAVVDAFVAHVAADKRINGFFAKTATDPERLKMFKMQLVNQICEASGGPCRYTGKDMKTAHMGMGVSGAHFNALVEDLVWALDKFKVGKMEKDQLLGALGPMKGDIVERP